jgi:trimethylamine---corrinoid protein Co-methyltransferase
MATIAIKVLSEREAEQVHDASLRVLWEVGVNVWHERLAARLLAAGARPGATNERVRFPAAMIRDALALCPREISLCSIRGEIYTLRPGNRYFSSCVVDPFMLDYADGKRSPRLADCATNARLIDALDTITTPYKMDVDYVEATGDQALLQSNLAFMSNMSKHYICGPHGVGDARAWMEMSEIMAGASLSQRPVVSALVSPTSPLTFDRPYLDLVDFLLTYGILLIMLPCPQAGATGPLAVAGTVVDFNAENLAALTLIQTLQPGAKVLYHNVGMGFDMHAGLSSLGGPEKTLCAVAGVDMARFYDLPAGCAGTATNSVRYDIQNGAETMAQLLPALASGACMITGIGSIGNGMGTSAEQILFDCDLIALANYLTAGIRVNEERLAVDAFGRVGPGATFLEDPSTLHFLRSDEHFYGGSFDKSGATEPGRGMYERLHSRVQQILAKHVPAVPPERVAALRQYVAERIGLAEDLPA